MFAHIEELLRRDPAERGVAGFTPADQLKPACFSLFTAAKRVVICTGFPVEGPDGWVPETDGPPGALALGDALAALGVERRYVAGARCEPVLGQAWADQPTQFLDLELGEWVTAEDFLTGLDCTHLIAIERPGRGADDRYWTMRGEPLESVSALDELFLVAAERAIKTIGVGDGGNEVGMGKVSGQVAAAVPHGDQIACVVDTDWTIVSGVSTWGAWGLVAGLSLLANQDLLPTEATARAQLDALVAAGAVDGITRTAAPTIDGLDWSHSADMLMALRAASTRGP